MTNPTDFTLSDPQRIKIVRDWLVIGMKNNQISIFEVRRAMAMLLREDSERQAAEARERSH